MIDSDRLQDWTLVKVLGLRFLVSDCLTCAGNLINGLVILGSEDGEPHKRQGNAGSSNVLYRASKCSQNQARSQEAHHMAIQQPKSPRDLYGGGRIQESEL